MSTKSFRTTGLTLKQLERNIVDGTYKNRDTVMSRIRMCVRTRCKKNDVEAMVAYFAAMAVRLHPEKYCVVKGEGDNKRYDPHLNGITPGSGCAVPAPGATPHTRQEATDTETAQAEPTPEASSTDSTPDVKDVLKAVVDGIGRLGDRLERFDVKHTQQDSRLDNIEKELHELKSKERTSTTPPKTPRTSGKTDRRQAQPRTVGRSAADYTILCDKPVAPKMLPTDVLKRWGVRLHSQAEVQSAMRHFLNCYIKANGGKLPERAAITDTRGTNPVVLSARRGDELFAFLCTIEEDFQVLNDVYTKLERDKKRKFHIVHSAESNQNYKADEAKAIAYAARKQSSSSARQYN